jgi:hypothetical protein
MTSRVVVAKIEQDKLIVTQANKLIEASYTMTLEEKRVVLLMVSLVRKDDQDFQTYRIPITDIRDYLGLRTNKLYDDIKRVADSLLSRVLHIAEEDGGWLKVGWVASARYVPKGRKGAEMACLDLSFSPEMKPYLLELKSHFANYMLQNVAELRSFYSIRLYELLKSRRRLQSFTLAVADLRRMLKAEAKYANHKDFRTRVILTAQSELAGKTDIAFEFEEARRGRKVMAITFTMRDNAPTKPPRSITRTIPPSFVPADDRQPQLLPPTEADREYQRLTAEAIAEGVQNGVRESAMRDLLAGRDPRHILENIELARQRHLAGKGKGESNLAGLTVAAITNDYASDAREKRRQAAERAAANDRVKEEQARREELEDSRKCAVIARLAAMPAMERDALRAAFAAEIRAGRHGESMAAAFRAKGWKAAGVESLFRMYAMAQF